MPRPFKRRRVCGGSGSAFFKPQGIPLRECGIINLQMDELEALKQAHLLGKIQLEGAEAMGISRSTFQRILEQAHLKLTQALVEQSAIHIEGGPVHFDCRHFKCADCKFEWEEPFGSGPPGSCPECESVNVFRLHPAPPDFTAGGRGKRHRGSY